MNFLKNNKKPGFTLMEVAIAVLIVAILVLACIPIIKNQLKKADEYSYYMAFKTVEKLGGQIVALGDPNFVNIDNGTRIANNTIKSNVLKKNSKMAERKVKFFFTSLGSRFAYSEHYLFQKLFPKTFAAETIVSDLFSWDSTLYTDTNLNYRICSGEQIVKDEAYDDESGVHHDATYWTKNDILGGSENVPAGTDPCAGYTTSSNGVGANYIMMSFVDLDACNVSGSSGNEETGNNAVLTSNLNNLGAYVKQAGNASNAKNFCESWSYIRGKCQRTDPDNSNISYTVEYNETIEPAYTDDEGVEWPAESYGTCKIIKKEKVETSTPDAGNNWTRPQVASNVCSSYYGYYNMTNAGAPYNINCVCSDSYPELSYNNDRVCCKVPSDANQIAYAFNHSCVYCTNDFNELNGTCCPEHSTFDGNACTCADGYTMNNAKTECIRSGCSAGTHFDEVNKVCVTNSPIVKAKRFCELIKDNWNISASNCNTFSTTNNVAVYNAVYNAAKGTNGNLLSIKSQDKAFANITPNIELSNGLKLWIMSDKAASVAGLSYNPTGITASRNICRDLNKTTLSDCKDADEKAYFCKSENHCFTFDDDSYTTMTDARNCCASTDLANIASQSPTNYEKQNIAFAINGFTVFVDINGTKGTGTLWEDVFPFYVSANGTVYPGYPLDAPKAANADTTALYMAANSASYLPADVYYFETDAATNNTRRKVIAYPAVSYARALCSSRMVSEYTPYCKNLGDKYHDVNGATNPCDSRKCFVGVRNKLRFF